MFYRAATQNPKESNGESPTSTVRRRVVAILFFFAWVVPAFGQANQGELQLTITDPSGAGITAAAHIVSQANQYANTLTANAQGRLVAQRLPYGVYQVQIQQSGFAPVSETVEIHSSIPTRRTIQLKLSSVEQSVTVSSTETLLDPAQSSSVTRIGSAQIQGRLGSLPGRSIQDLINTQPGWLYEGNAVLHPRGTEAQTQFVIDGIPLTDNRSPSFGPEIEADDIDSMSIYTAGIPAEYGRKMGGVVELNTSRDTNTGLHGQLVLSGGSYDTAQGYGQVQDVWGRNALAATSSGSRTGHYLNPVVPENYTNNGTTGDFSLRYERELTDSDRFNVSVRHELSRFEIPNERIQQQNGQLQTGDNIETLGNIRYQHVFSSNALGTLVGMVRDNANDLYSNENSTPILAFQHNHFREGYFKGSFSLHRGRHELKAGVESDAAFLHEYFAYQITDDSQFDPDTPIAPPPFIASRPDLEQSAFVQDRIRLGKWTLSAGLRWDHYQLLLNQHALSPRISLGRYLPSLNTVVHFSYDRVFQTPSFENILISSSNQINVLSGSFLHLPVQPSKGDYFEGGLTTAFSNHLKTDVNVYRRAVRNYSDDDQLLNTGVSYPISFDKAVIYGAEAKLELVRLGSLSGYLSYSYMVGNAWYPVTGGLFLGNDVSDALSQLTGHFPDSQDQRNTARTRFQYQLLPRVLVASGASYGSGLPFQFGGTQADALAQYGPAVISRINFDRGRIRPLFALSASVGVEAYKNDKVSMRFQADGDNLTDRLNVIDFGGLFSGNAIGPSRSFSLRLITNF